MPLLSRVAESLFWLGRYAERAENTARLLDVAYHARLEPAETEITGATNTWHALIASLGLREHYFQNHEAATEVSTVEYLTVDRTNSSSILSCLALARENARSVRDYLSSEAWVSINRWYHGTANRNVHLIMADGLYDFCESIRQGAHLFAGTVEGTSLHDEGWHWLRSGQLLERADMITRIVDSKYHLLMPSLDDVGGPIDRYQWTAVLRGVSGYEAYRRTHIAGISAAEAAHFLLLNPQFPRSLRSCIEGLQDAITQATAGAPTPLRNPPLRIITGLETRLHYESVDSLVQGGLHEFVQSAQSDLGRVSRVLSESFFFWTPAHAA